jgi:hypothetical protein
MSIIIEPEKMRERSLSSNKKSQTAPVKPHSPEWRN